MRGGGVRGVGGRHGEERRGVEHSPRDGRAVHSRAGRADGVVAVPLRGGDRGCVVRDNVHPARVEERRPVAGAGAHLRHAAQKRDATGWGFSHRGRRKSASRLTSTTPCGASSEISWIVSRCAGEEGDAALSGGPTLPRWIT